MSLVDTLAHVGYLSVEECNRRFGEAAVEAAYTAGTVRRHREWSGCLTLTTPCANVCGGMLAPD